MLTTKFLSSSLPSSSKMYNSLKRKINRIRDELFKYPKQDKYNSIIKIMLTDERIPMLLGGDKREFRFLLEATINNFQNYQIDTKELENLANNFYIIKD